MEILHDPCISCEKCAGETSTLIYVDDELICTGCASGKRECAG